MSSSSSSPSAPPALRTKSLDLESYFNDLSDEQPAPTRRAKKLPARPVTRVGPLRRPARPRHERSSSATVPPSRDDDWVAERWAGLVARQRAAEAAVRRAILRRDRLHPIELAKWLDSDETCSLPCPSLGVRMRMRIGSQEENKNEKEMENEEEEEFK